MRSPDGAFESFSGTTTLTRNMVAHAKARGQMIMDLLDPGESVAERELPQWQPATLSPAPRIESGKSDLKFRFIDLFAGIGGMRLAFDAAGGKCVFTSEWNKFSQKTYEDNFEDERPIAGDITGIELDDIPAHDVLVAGFPCQPFSIAGVSKKNALGRPH